ncbi:MAG: small, acid-soluble spore protein, H family [Bacillota bacterium]
MNMTRIKSILTSDREVNILYDNSLIKLEGVTENGRVVFINLETNERMIAPADELIEIELY